MLHRNYRQCFESDIYWELYVCVFVRFLYFLGTLSLQCSAKLFVTELSIYDNDIQFYFNGLTRFYHYITDNLHTA